MFWKREFDDLSTMAYFSDYVKPERDHFLVDVRTPQEFMMGRIPGAVNIPLNEIMQRMGELPKDKEIIVVCASGNRSQSAATYIKRAGFEKVYNLQGGTMGWMRQGYQTVR